MDGCTASGPDFSYFVACYCGQPLLFMTTTTTAKINDRLLVMCPYVVVQVDVDFFVIKQKGDTKKFLRQPHNHPLSVALSCSVQITRPSRWPQKPSLRYCEKLPSAAQTILVLSLKKKKT